jgi:hypothetical protein
MRKLSYPQLREEIRSVLAQARQSLNERAIAVSILRRNGIAGDAAVLARRVSDAIRATPGLAVRVGFGWMLPPQPQPQPQQKAETGPKLGKDGETLDPEGQSRRMQKVWARRDYEAPLKKGEPAF